MQLRSSGGAWAVSAISNQVLVNGGTAADLDKLLIVSIGMFDPDGVLPTVTGVDFAGEALTLLDTNTPQNQIWYLLNPSSTGVSDVNVNFSDIATSGIIAGMFTGVDLTDPLSVVTKTNAASATPSGSISNVSAQDALWDLLTVNQGGSVATRIATGTGQVKIGADTTLVYDAGTNYSATASRYILPNGGDTATTSYTLSAAKTWRMQTVQIKHKQYGASPSQFLMGS